MKDFVYAIVHDGAGRFLMARKNLKSYYYDNTVFTAGKKIRKGAGDLTFPGGTRNRGEPYLECALRKFLEETGFDLIGQVDQYYTKTLRHARDIQYTGIYLRAVNYDQLHDTIKLNLIDANTEAVQIRAGELKERQQGNGQCVKNNE